MESISSLMENPTVENLLILRNLLSKRENQIEFNDGSYYKSLEVVLKLHVGTKLGRIGIQVLSNGMTANKDIQAVQWPFFLQSNLIYSYLHDKDEKTIKTCLVWIYNTCNNDKDNTLLMVKYPNGLAILERILVLCEELVNDQNNSCFELGIAVITSVIEIDALPLLYRSLRGGETPKTALLKVLDGLVQSYSEAGQFHCLTQTCNFMVDLLDMTVDQTLNEGTLQKNSDILKSESLKLFYLIQFWKISSSNIASSSEEWAQRGLPSTLTKCLGILNKILPAATSLKSPIENPLDHPLYQFKSDVTKVISNLAFHYTSYKEYFLDAIPLVLSNCSIDDLNPYIRESSLFCIRNLIVGCERNANFVADMEVRGMAPNPVLKELGFEAELDRTRNKIKIQNFNH